MRVPHNADRAKVITACATLARTSWHVDDDEMADVMRQHCCVARDAVDRMQERILELEAENARLRTVGQRLRDISAATNRLVARSGITQGDIDDAVSEWDDVAAKRGTHG